MMADFLKDVVTDASNEAITKATRESIAALGLNEWICRMQMDIQNQNFHDWRVYVVTIEAIAIDIVHNNGDGLKPRLKPRERVK